MAQAQGRYNGPAGLSLKSRMIAQSAWYPVETLMSLVTDMRGQNLTTQAARDLCLNKLATMSQGAPFAHNRRFPAGEVYICEAYGGWSKSLQQLRAALMYKDDRNTGAARGNDNSTSASGSSNANTKPANSATANEQQANDAFTAGINITTTIMTEILNLQGVIDQYVFETKLNNTWMTKADAQQNTPWVKEAPTSMIGDASLTDPTI